MIRILQKIILLAVMFLSSVLMYSQDRPEEHSILRLSSTNFDGKIVYAVAMADGSIKALTSDDADYKLENSLWFVKYPIYGVDGATMFDEWEHFTLQNLGTGQYLNVAYRDGVDGATLHYLITSTKPSFIGVDTSWDGYELQGFGVGLVVQYDPYYNEWRYYESLFTDYNRNESQEKAETAGNAWTNGTHPPSNEESSMEIFGGRVEELLGDTVLSFEDVVNNLDAITDLIYKEDVLEAAPEPIIVGDEKTYPKGYWKTDIIQLNVTYVDWTPVSFPVDVKCVTADLSGVGYQEYSTAKRANGESAWVTNYVTSDMVFEKGVAYHFATDSEVMTLDFRPITGEELTKVEKSYSKTLTATTGNITTNQNWYYIGNALFVEAGMSGVDMISRYNKAIGKWEEEPVSGAVNPFDAFFVQYSGDYAMSASLERTNAPMRDRKVVTEKYCLNIVGEGVEDKTYLYFEGEASAEGYVIGEDFLSFATIGGANTEIYTYAGDIDYSFNTRPIENTLVYVGLYIAKAGTYTISLDNISGNAETFVLYDNYEQDFVRLHLGETYTFYSERGEFNDRFGVAVTYAPEVPTDNISLSANKLIVVNNEIQGLTLGNELMVYDAMGHLVYVANVDSETMILPNLNSGIYIARNGNGWAKFLVK